MHQLPVEHTMPPARVKKVESRGKTIMLDDGSVWEIFFFDSIISSLWLPFTEVVERREQGNPYPYTTVLERVDSGQKVRAKRVI